MELEPEWPEPLPLPAVAPVRLPAETQKHYGHCEVKTNFILELRPGTLGHWMRRQTLHQQQKFTNTLCLKKHPRHF